jgi:hypothetical protein
VRKRRVAILRTPDVLAARRLHTLQDGRMNRENQDALYDRLVKVGLQDPFIRAVVRLEFLAAAPHPPPSGATSPRKRGGNIRGAPVPFFDHTRMHASTEK